MKSIDEIPIEEREFIMGEVMSKLSFDELIRQLTGVSYSQMQKEYDNSLENGVRNE